MNSYINELKLKQKLHRVAAISVISLLILCAFAYATFRVLSYVYQTSSNEQFESTLKEYAITMKRRALEEQSALRTLASFTKSGDDLIASFNSTDSGNLHFEVVGFWNTDGTCRQISLNGSKVDGHYKNLPPQMKLAISTAWLGNPTVTSPYYSPTIGQNLITYVNPVFNNEGKVIGALSGAIAQKSFNQTLDQLSIINQGVDSVLCTSSGLVFSYGVNEHLTPNIKNMLEYQGFDSLALDRLRASLVSSMPHTIDTHIDGKKYRLNITPLGFSDWYLVTLISNEVSRGPYFNALILLIVSLCIIFLVCSFIAIYLFISMKNSYKTQLRIAHYDPITNSYNYPKFLLEFDMLDYRSGSNHVYAVVSLNIHDFSYIEDLLGESQTNDLLCAIAKVLGKQNNNDVLIFCHHEVDQFFLILNCAKPDEVDAKVRNIINQCVHEITTNITSFPVVMYAGVAFTYSDLTPERIVARAEFAKKQIIKTYTHAVRFYDENAYKKEAFLHNIEKSMRNALENEEFKLFLQPKIDLSTGKIYAAEALVRWISDSDVIVYPNDFIPLFEQNGFCAELDLYMFDKACAHIRYYIDHNIEPIYYSINQTKLLIFQKGYTQKLQSILQKYAIPPKYIVIEVLEDLAIHNVEELNMHLKSLKDTGLSIALDDFGSGYSSLNIVAGLDIDEIKFDREFLMVNEHTKLEKNQMILRVLSKLSKEMGIRTVVEGVERREDVEFLQGIDCDIAQGYYYDRPIPVDVFDKKYMMDRPLLDSTAAEIKQLENTLVERGVQIYTAATTAAINAAKAAVEAAKAAEEAAAAQAKAEAEAEAKANEGK